MAQANTTKTAPAAAAAATYTVDQLAASKRYANRRDLIRALLDSGKRYTLDEVDRLIESYMKGQVK